VVDSWLPIGLSEDLSNYDYVKAARERRQSRYFGEFSAPEAPGILDTVARQSI
jgi:hypothetical protein